MNSVNLEFQAIWKILAVGLLLGSGVPVLFATGIRSLAYGQGGDAEAHTSESAGPAPHPIGIAVGALCLAVVLAVVALGLLYIVVTGQGKVLSFDHIYPTITAKKH